MAEAEKFAATSNAASVTLALQSLPPAADRPVVDAEAAA